jgi:hypothetical protein
LQFFFRLKNENKSFSNKRFRDAATELNKDITMYRAVLKNELLGTSIDGIKDNIQTSSRGILQPREMSSVFQVCLCDQNIAVRPDFGNIFRLALVLCITSQKRRKQQHTSPLAILTIAIVSIQSETFTFAAQANAQDI